MDAQLFAIVTAELKKSPRHFRMTKRMGRKKLLDQSRVKLERAQEIRGVRDTTSSGMKTIFDISNAPRRDFKISHQIGMPGQNEKLSFVSLIRQIENGLARDYQEAEIVEAVVKAISPGI